LVDLGADSPDLGVGAGGRLDADAAELGDGGDEGVEEGGLVGGEVVDGGARAAVGEEHLVGGEEALELLQRLEVAIVELVGRDGVEHGDGGRAVAERARLPHLPQERQVHRRAVLRRRPLELVQPPHELVAVRHPYRVPSCTTFGDHVGLGEAVGGEELVELVEVEGGAGEAVLHHGARPDLAVKPPQLHLVVGSSCLHDDVAGGEGEDVGAGDLVGALGVGVDGGLGAGDEVQRVRRQRRVRARAVLVVRPRDQHRRVAPPDEAVVEEEAERPRRGVEGLLELLRDGAADERLHVGARRRVVALAQLRRRAGRRRQQHGDHHHHHALALTPRPRPPPLPHFA
ncbi:Os06g0695451, partial [Oryza sativa Japonica Group]